MCLWIICGLTLVLAKPIIKIYNVSPEAGTLAWRMIALHMVFACVIWPIGFTLPTAFRAASDVKYPLVISMISMWAFRVALSYVFAQQTVSVFGFGFAGLSMGAFGVWLAMGVDWLFRGVLFLLHYLRGKWVTVYDRLHEHELHEAAQKEVK